MTVTKYSIVLTRKEMQILEHAILDWQEPEELKEETQELRDKFLKILLNVDDDEIRKL